jgi:predicted oxidoreductase
MKKIQLPGASLNVSAIIMGCMRINRLQKPEIEKLVRTAIDAGINFFDHADRYGQGECESLFAEAVRLTGDLREQLIIQSKCGIRQGFYDSSKTHILTAVDGILQRLKTPYLDVLLLHRPDALIEPAEVAEAFETLHSSGKVRYFGVSNYNPAQIALLQKYVPYKLIVNQLQLSIMHTPMIDSGMTVNMHIDQSVGREGGVLDYCRLHELTIQAWSPFQRGFFEGVFLNDPNYATLNETIDRIAAKYNVSNTAVAVGWITRHPANIQVILGTTKPQRLIDSCKGADLPLTREEWYEIYKVAGNTIP